MRDYIDAFLPKFNNAFSSNYRSTATGVGVEEFWHTITSFKA
jgi:hypothetical protein